MKKRQQPTLLCLRSIFRRSASAHSPNILGRSRSDKDLALQGSHRPKNHRYLRGSVHERFEKLNLSCSIAVLYEIGICKLDECHAIILDQMKLLWIFTL